MSSPMASAVVMATITVLVLSVVVADGRTDKRWDGRKHHHSGMDDCGRNRTCRELSRECKKLLFTSMVDNYADAGDKESVTTVDKMAAMMKMFMEHKQNLTDCANETGIQLPNSHVSSSSNILEKVMTIPGRTIQHKPGPMARFGVSLSLNKVIPYGGRFRPKRSGGKWKHGNFGVSEEDAIELRKCLLSKKMMLNPDGSLNRENLKAQISPAFSFQAGLQAAVEEAVNTCPEPQDYNIHELNKCINKACVDNLQLDDDTSFPQDTKVVRLPY